MTSDQILERDGVSPYLRGYYHLKDLIESYDPCLTLKAQYDRIAEKKGSTRMRVEKNCMNALLHSSVPTGVGVKKYVARAHVELEKEKQDDKHRND